MSLHLTAEGDEDQVTRLEVLDQILIFSDNHPDNTFSFNDGNRLQTMDGVGEAVTAITRLIRELGSTQPLVTYLRRGGCRIYPPQSWPVIRIH